MRFNPPPNWETIRPGWTPPQGWQPDESYPPIPDGWQIWVEEDEKDPSRRKTALVVGAVVAIAVITVVVLWIVSLSGDKSAEEQINDVVDTAQNAFNNADAQAYSAQFCPDTINHGGLPTAAEMQASLEAMGTVAYSIQELNVSGETATARFTVTHASGQTDEPGIVPNVEFREQDGDWKFCSTIDFGN